MERCARVHCALRPYPAPMAVHDTLDGCETYPRPGKLVYRVKSLEWCEQLARKGHVEPGAVVADEEPGKTACIGPPELDASDGHLGGELPGISNQVFYESSSQSGIHLRVKLVLHFDFDRPEGIRGM